MTTDEIVSGLDDARKLLGDLPAPVGPMLRILIDLGEDVARRAGEQPDGDPVEMLHLLRQSLRLGVAADWQAAIEKGEGGGS